MTDNPELASLTIKDLRQLAGEHNIQNRSRLGKEELISALQAVLSTRSGQLADAPAAAEATASAAGRPMAAAGAAEPENVEDDEDDGAEALDAGLLDGDDDSDDSDAVVPPMPVSTTEPEMITAESVAMLTSPGARRASAPQQRNAGSHAGDRGGDRPRGDAGPRAPQADGDHADGANPEGAHADGEHQHPDGEPRRRRRRRRGRGRGRGRDGEHLPGQGPGQGDSGPDRSGHFDDDVEEGEGAGPVQPHGDQRDPAGAGVSDGGHPAPVDRPAPISADVRPAPMPGQRPPQRDDHRPPQRDDHRSQPNQGRQQNGPGQGQQGRPQHPPGRPDLRQNDRPNDRHNDQRQHQEPRQPQDHRQQPHGQQDQRPPRPRLDGPQRPVPSVLDRLCSFSKGILELCDPSTPSWAQARLSELLAESGMVVLPASGQPHPDFHEVVGTIATRSVPPGHIAEITAPGFALRGDRGDLFALRRARVKVAEGGPRQEAPRPVIDAAPTAPTATSDAVDIPDEIPDIVEVTVEPTTPDVDADADADARASAPAPRSDARSEPRPPRDDRRQAPRAPQPAPAAGRTPLRTHAPELASDAPMLPLAQQVPDELAARPKAEGFRALGLNDQILADLAAMGFSTPSPIQEEAIPIVLTGKDLLGQAQTGTGKTAAFALPILQRLYSLEGTGPVALVLCPTRELARQVHSEFTKMSGASGARATVIYGGVSMEDQNRALDRKPHVVIGTPGRIIDHMRRKTLDLSRLAVAVLDEADQMLDIGFWPDVNFIISHTPPNRQMLLFSATFPEPVKLLAEKHMKDPAHVRISPKNVTVEQVDQKYIAVVRERKNELLAHFIDTQKPEQLLVFCRTKHQTDRVAEVLKRKHMSAAAIHGDLPQSKRERTLQDFRNRELQCLIATNVAARGLDIPTVSHVVNYDIPEAPEEYVHRIGRTARNGAQGVARTFITPEDGQFLVEIEKHIGLLLEEEKIEGFTEAPTVQVKRAIADMPVGVAPRILKPLVGGIRLGRRRG